MSLTKERVYYLLKAYISKQASSEEELELMEWILEADEDSELKSYVREIWDQYKPSEDLSYVDREDVYSRTIQGAANFVAPKIRKMRWHRWSAAAVILVALTAGVYFYLNPSSQPLIVKVESKQNDIAPPSANKAVLTLSNGTIVQLDNKDSGTIALQGNVQITKQSSGTISYSGSSGREVTYNSLSVPKGSKPFLLLLSDGSKVWINVGSEIIYPTSFSGAERRIKITGEAYFEVSQNLNMPFVVEHNDITISVLGTHFNVNTYKDEPADRITLLEGSVVVNKNKFSQILKPGQQGSVDHGTVGNINVLDNVNLEEVMSWKNGQFIFSEKTDISSIMRQISRWYNVEIEYEGKVDKHFWGSISKEVNLSQVLEILEATGGVKFKVEDNKIIVMPASL